MRTHSRTRTRTRTISTATALAVLFSSAALVAATAGPAAADSAHLLGVKSAADILVDGAHQRVYVSDPVEGKIVVTDYAGAVKATLDGLPDVDGLALSADSGQVYAAVAGLNRIVAVDTSSYAQSASYKLDGAEKPRTLAMASGKLWFGYGSGGGGIGSLDLSGAEPVVALGQDGEASFYAAPELGSDPDSGVLVAGEKDISTGELTVYDVSGPKPELKVTKSVDGAFFDDIAVSPDGTQIVTASGAPYYHPVYSTEDLSPIGRYNSGDYGAAVDIAPDGTVAAGTSSWYGPDVHIYQQGKWSKVREYEFPNTGNSSGADTLAEGGLAWAPDGSRLFAVSENSEGVFSLRVLTEPDKSLPELTVAAPEKGTRAKSLTVSGKITDTAAALPAGTELTVTRSDIETPNGKKLPAVKTKADGSFSFDDTPPAGGKVAYKVAYAGDATHAAASGSDAVEVSRSATKLTLNKNGNVYSYGADVSFTAHLGTTYKNRTVEIWADPYGSDKPNKLVKKGAVNARGDLSATVDMKRDTKVTAVFAGDARYASTKATSTAYAKVKVSASVAGHYKTGKIGSTTYHYFHKNTDPVLKTTMSYYKGRKHRFEMQVRVDGRWRSAGASEYFRLGADGTSAVRVEAPGESGIRARMRASYVNGTSGDNVNSTTHGSWKYLNFTR
ncbi:hypothetical protein GCM10009837_76660 [Streptomyces durmitorensis]|uniref:Ig-like domain repeat protein n=1 Tax=Streptomyces durmitorensis TaxID=319947 RepID=A0ABY4PXU6_9ACTN|nr:Ig-like domain repeat protein [Streptomyces durmitorensis]UQT57771.1 Ig-like domain repeat protein [Streptomyces durmitorensis]